MSRVSGLRRRWWIEGNDVAVFVVPVVVSDALDVAGLGRSPADADADADALPVLALLLPPTAAAATAAPSTLVLKRASSLRGRSHGFCIGHVVPEAQVGGSIALVRDGDVISVDAVKNTIELQVPEDELERRRAEWVAPPLKVKTGTLYKYIKNVEDASRGCVTDA